MLCGIDYRDYVYVSSSIIYVCGTQWLPGKNYIHSGSITSCKIGTYTKFNYPVKHKLPGLSIGYIIQ